jgi:dihydroneopterin aldolase
MDRIFVKDIRCYSYHGCLAEETTIGCNYLVQVEVTADLTPSCTTDALSDTVDYCLLHQIVVEEMAKPSKLLETVVLRIIHKMFEKEQRILSAEVEVAKLNPPINGDVAQVAVCLKRNRNAVEE